MATIPHEKIIASEGVGSLAADTNKPFDFTTQGVGNRIVIACEAGGLFRISWDGTTPSTTITTRETTSRFGLCDGNELILDIDGNASFINLHCKSVVTNLAVTLLKGRSKDS